MKLLRTIRLDPSDTFVYERAAEPGEWAVPGGFAFWGEDPAAMAGKRRAAFRGGFLGLGSFGWSTLAIVTEATAQERANAVDALALHLVSGFGAPDLAAARAAAEDEIRFSESLCEEHPAQMLIAVHRSVEDGDVREQFRTLTPGKRDFHARAFGFLEVEGDDVPEERLDLAGLAEKTR